MSFIVNIPFVESTMLAAAQKTMLSHHSDEWLHSHTSSLKKQKTKTKPAVPHKHTKKIIFRNIYKQHFYDVHMCVSPYIPGWIYSLFSDSLLKVLQEAI